MKSAVVYYSYSGNTKMVAERLVSALSAQGSTAPFPLKDLKETRSFLGQCGRAFRHATTDIEGAPLDVSGYTHVCIGTPVWAFAPAPPVTTYLKTCEAIAGRKVLLFVTCGSGTGVEKCFIYMEGELKKKGVAAFSRLLIPQSKIKDDGFIDNAINAAVAAWA